MFTQQKTGDRNASSSLYQSKNVVFAQIVLDGSVAMYGRTLRASANMQPPRKASLDQSDSVDVARYFLEGGVAI